MKKLHPLPSVQIDSIHHTPLSGPSLSPSATAGRHAATKTSSTVSAITPVSGTRIYSKQQKNVAARVPHFVFGYPLRRPEGIA